MTESRIAVIGATGAVGAVTLRLLRDRGYENVRAFASSRSAGQMLDRGLVVEEATPDALAAGDIDLALFSVGSGVAHSGPTCKPDRGETRRVWHTSRACGQFTSSL